MRTLRLFGIALVAVVLCAGFSAYSDDDNDSGSTSLKGTTWKIVKQREYDHEEDKWNEEREDVGCWLTFNANGTVTSNWYDGEYDDDDDYGYFIKYTFDGTTLTMNFSDDDCTTGTFVIDGNTATYTCYWNDAPEDGSEWSNESEYFEVWTFEKQ